MWKTILLQLSWCLLISAHPPLHYGGPGPILGHGLPHKDVVHTAVHPIGHNGLAKEHRAISHDPFGGKTIQHHVQASHHDPFSGQTDLKHSHHAVHLNPFIGKAAVHSGESSGHVDPIWGKAAFQQRNYKSQNLPGHAAVHEAISGAAVNPFGNSASHQIYQARADHLHGGLAHGAKLVQSHHDINKWGGGSRHTVAKEHGFHGHGIGELHTGSQTTETKFHPGFSAINQNGHVTHHGYNAKAGFGSTDQLAFSRHAAQDAWGNYKGVSHSTHITKGGPLGHHHVAHFHGHH